jgi:hypothetical protein
VQVTIRFWGEAKAQSVGGKTCSEVFLNDIFYKIIRALFF